MGGPPPGAGRGADLGYGVGGATVGMGVHKGEGVFCADHTGAAEGVEGLYAAGDALGSMMVGSVYPGRGFSSYGSAIQGRRAARFAVEFVKGAQEPRVAAGAIDKLVQTMWAPRENEEGFSPQWVTQTLRNTMAPLHIMYIKEPRRLDGALASIEYLRQHVVPMLIAQDGHELRLAHETANMLLNAEMKLRAGLFRTESRGTHFREDFPARNDREWRPSSGSRTRCSTAVGRTPSSRHWRSTARRVLRSCCCSTRPSTRVWWSRVSPGGWARAW